jgi:hypothetical protein
MAFNVKTACWDCDESPVTGFGFEEEAGARISYRRMTGFPAAAMVFVGN